MSLIITCVSGGVVVTAVITIIAADYKVVAYIVTVVFCCILKIMFVATTPPYGLVPCLFISFLLLYHFAVFIFKVNFTLWTYFLNFYVGDKNYQCCVLR